MQRIVLSLLVLAPGYMCNTVYTVCIQVLPLCVLHIQQLWVSFINFCRYMYLHTWACKHAYRYESFASCPIHHWALFDKALFSPNNCRWQMQITLFLWLQIQHYLAIKGRLSLAGKRGELWQNHQETLAKSTDKCPAGWQGARPEPDSWHLADTQLNWRRWVSTY